MIFGILLIISFLIGIPIGIFTSRIASVKAIKKSPTIIIFTPTLILFFLSFFTPDIPMLDNIRYMFLFLAIGIVCSWSYFDISPKDK